MAAISLHVFDVVQSHWDYTNRRYVTNLNTKFFNNVNNKDTYYIIFGPDQEEHEKLFVEHVLPKFKLLFKSQKACNVNYLTGPRNTLYIFEYDE